MRPEWTDFVGGKWDKEVNVRDFIQRNYHPYDGDESFLAEGGAMMLVMIYPSRCRTLVRLAEMMIRRS